MQRARFIISAIVALLVVALLFAVLSSSVDYKKMSCAEKLKNQLLHEMGTYDTSIFETVEVERSWYSLSSTDWTFIVTFAPDAEIRYYKYQSGRFYQIA